MGWPNFIIVGAMKCGTSVLWHNLNKHPHIQMVRNPEDPKIAGIEIRFWNDGQPYHTFTNKGTEWYRSLFDDNKCQGTKCANYIEKKQTIKRISKHIPNIKLIICIREPISRAFSEFIMQSNGTPFTYELALQKGYLGRSKYYKQITNNVLPFFPRENLHIIIQEQMKNNTNEEMNKLYKFLGVPELSYDVKKITSKEATDRNLDLKKDSKIKSYKVWKTKYKSPINKNLKNQLKEYFKKHNDNLFEFLGYSIEEWV